MKRFTGILFLLLLSVVFVSSCNVNMHFRRIEVHIPEHPWEKYTDKSLWYYMKWTDGGVVNVRYVESSVRDVSLEIPLGETVYICAYPLGDMQCFGCAVTPQNTGTVFELTQNEGFLADLIMNCDSTVRKHVNFDVLCDACARKTDDFRTLDSVLLVQDILNGQLSQTSVSVRKSVAVEPFPLQEGIWISESVLHGRMMSDSGMSAKLMLPVGLHRFYNDFDDMELRIVVDPDGTVFHTQRRAMIPLFTKTR